MEERKTKAKEKLTKKQRGITLIALVITIIVLLILAGVSIAMLTGNNGILTQVQKAKNRTEEAQEDELRKLTALEAATNLSNTIYKDKNEQIVTIPAGFAVSKVEGENTVEDGLVIIDSKGNEFVWIPVETPAANSESEGSDNKAIAIKQGNNYRGLLYDFTEEGSTVINGCTSTTNANREPDIVSDYDENIKYNNGLFTKESLQEDYNKMIESVNKYYGFYVGRYELGLEGINPVVKNANTNTNVTTADAVNSNTRKWYGLYSKCKEFSLSESDSSVVSSMMWGSQYDAMLNWMQENGVDVTSTGTKNTSNKTGSNLNDVIKNIFDIYGCHYEWTLEASSTSFRVYRGGRSVINNFPSYRPETPDKPDSAYDRNTARITLYIK